MLARTAYKIKECKLTENYLPMQYVLSDMNQNMEKGSYHLELLCKRPR